MVEQRIGIGVTETMVDAQSGLSLFSAIAAAGKSIYDIAQGVGKIETKQQLHSVYDTLMDLKQRAAALEDENRELRAKLHFRSDDFEFRNPFWYEKSHPDRPLCAKCFASQTAAPMSEPYEASGTFRRCLVCNNYVEIERGRKHNPGPYGGPSGPNSWMR